GVVDVLRRKRLKDVERSIVSHRPYAERDARKRDENSGIAEPAAWSTNRLKRECEKERSGKQHTIRPQQHRKSSSRAKQQKTAQRAAAPPLSERIDATANRKDRKAFRQCSRRIGTREKAHSAKRQRPLRRAFAQHTPHGRRQQPASP